MIQSVDIGEATIGVLGIINVLEEKASLGVSSRDAVAAYPRTIDLMARDLVTGVKIKGKYNKYDQKKMAKLLTEDPSEALGHLAGCSWADHAAAIGQAIRIRNALAAARPISQVTNLFVVKDLPVASFVWHGFEDIVSLLDDPLSMFAAIQCGRVTRKLVATFAQGNRSVYAAMAGSIATRAVDEYAKGSELPPELEDSLSTFLSVDGIGSKVAAALGSPKQQGQKSKPTSDVEHGTGISLAPKSASIDGQK